MHRIKMKKQKAEQKLIDDANLKEKERKKNAGAITDT